MVLAIAIVAVALLLIAFLALTAFERKRGARILGSVRAPLDAIVSRTRSLLPGDPASAAWHSFSRGARVAVHEVVHTTLAVIRAIERALTRAARAVRESNAAHALGMHRPDKETTEVE